MFVKLSCSHHSSHKPVNKLSVQVSTPTKLHQRRRNRSLNCKIKQNQTLIPRPIAPLNIKKNQTNSDKDRWNSQKSAKNPARKVNMAATGETKETTNYGNIFTLLGLVSCSRTRPSVTNEHWDGFRCSQGRVSLYWSHAQRDYLKRMKIDTPTLHWTSSVLKLMFHTAWDLWQDRNNIKHHTATAAKMREMAHLGSRNRRTQDDRYGRNFPR